MSKQKQAAVEDPQSPNLIPMIDIMFLLLLFFMLGADMAARETQEMLLPEAAKAKEIDPTRDQTEPETIINIHHAPDGGVGCGKYDNKGVCRDKTHWKWTISGKSYEVQAFKDQLKLLSDLALEDEPDPIAKKKLSKRKILIRADRSAPYGDVQKVIEYCGQAGLYKVSVVGALPAPTE